MKLRGININQEIKSYLKDRKVVLLSLISFFIAAALFVSGVLIPFELKAYDLYSRYFNPANKSENIVIIEIDQQSLDALSKQGITWPWPRQMYAPIIEYLSDAEAVFIDLLFSEPSSYGQEDDQILAEAIKKASNVYLPVFLTNKKKGMSSGDRAFIGRISFKERIPTDVTFTSANTPIDLLRSVIKGSGNVTISPDNDGVYRRVPLFFKLDQYTVPHYLLSFLVQRGIVRIVKDSPFVGDHKIPLVDRQLLLRYSRNPFPFAEFSASEILNSYQDRSSSASPSVEKGFFKGKVVFIGTTAAGLYDLKPTAVAPVSTGVFIHATTLENIMNKNFIRPLPLTFVIGLMLVISFIICYGVLKSHSLIRNLSIFFSSLLVMILVTALLFRLSFYLKIIPPALSCIVSFTIAVAYSYATEGRQRIFLKNTILQYMDKKIADFLLDNPSLIKPGGQKKRVTVFFADIAGFTTMSEKSTPEKIATLLHKVLNSLTDVIIRNQGVIDKYIGDCVMAFWGAPFERDNDELNACYCAIKCMDALNQLNDGFRSDGLPSLNIRIGIHTGDAIAGNIGSDRLFHYTVIGDTVNLASRLESANKFFKTRIMVSGETIKKTENTFFTRELGYIAVKGKEFPIKIFELIGDEMDTDTREKAIVQLYNQGMQYHNQQKFREALEIFDEILGKYPWDGPSEFYRRRCADLISVPNLTEDWNIIKFTEK